jgi:hypothetical protein
MKAMRRRIALPKRFRREMFIASEVFRRKAAPPKRGARTSNRPRSRLRPRSTVTGYTAISRMLGRPRSRSSTLRFCIYRRQCRGKLLRAHASRGVAEFRPSVSSRSGLRKRRVVKTFALGERGANESAGATLQVVSSCALVFLEERGFRRHTSVRSQSRRARRIN